MPQLSEIVKNRKKFKKVEYRAWDPEGEWSEKNKTPNSIDSLNINPLHNSENSPITLENNNGSLNTAVNRVTSNIETDHKQITNRGQIDHKKDYKRITNRSQTENTSINNPLVSENINKLNNLPHSKELIKNREDKKNERVSESTYNKKIDHKQITKRPQTGHKKISKGSQIDHKIEDKQGTNRSQKEELSNQNHKIDHKQVTKQITEKITNRSQTDHKTELSTIVGKEREMLFFIFSSCLKNRSTVSEPLTLEYITRNSNIRLTSIKTIINRLIDKKFLMRTEGKRGRSGWMRFELPDEIYNKILVLEKETKWSNGSQIDYKRVTEQITEQITKAPSSSSILIKETSTNSRGVEIFLDNEWELIDISSLDEIGFGEPQLRQLAKAEKLTAEQVQDSIYAFAFARQQPDVAKSIRTNHLNYLMGILMKGEPYLPPPGYQSPQELALQAEIERKKKRLVLENQLKELNFEEWYGALQLTEKKMLLERELTDQDKETVFGRSVIPEYVREKKRKEALKAYFLNVVDEQRMNKANVTVSDSTEPLKNIES